MITITFINLLLEDDSFRLLFIVPKKL